MALALEDLRVSKWESFKKIFSLLPSDEQFSFSLRKIIPQTAKKLLADVGYIKQMVGLQLKLVHGWAWCVMSPVGGHAGS